MDIYLVLYCHIIYQYLKPGNVNCYLYSGCTFASAILFSVVSKVNQGWNTISVNKWRRPWFQHGDLCHIYCKILSTVLYFVSEFCILYLKHGFLWSNLYFGRFFAMDKNKQFNTIIITTISPTVRQNVTSGQRKGSYSIVFYILMVHRDMNRPYRVQTNESTIDSC